MWEKKITCEITKHALCVQTYFNEKFESEASLLSQIYTHVEYMERLPIQVDTTQDKKVEKRSILGHREK